MLVAVCKELELFTVDLGARWPQSSPQHPVPHRNTKANTAHQDMQLHDLHFTCRNSIELTSISPQKGLILHGGNPTIIPKSPHSHSAAGKLPAFAHVGRYPCVISPPANTCQLQYIQREAMY